MLAAEFRARPPWLVGIYLVGVFAIIMIQIFRDQHLEGYGLRLVLGSLPNFIAAVCTPALIMCWRRQYYGFASALIAAGLSQFFVLGWEFAQLVQPEMVFDASDITATVLGGLVWILCWPGLDKLLPAA